MNRNEIKRGGVYQIIDNISDHGFAVGDIVIVDTDIEDGYNYVFASLCGRNLNRMFLNLTQPPSLSGT